MKLLYLLLLLSFQALALEEYDIVIKDHQFTPNQVFIPAGQKIKLVVYNQDNEVEEFESFELRREKIIPANDKISIIIGPLEPGEYKFFGDFHSKTAQGMVVAK